MINIMSKESNNPLISVIIPVYNVGNYLIHTINSAINQTYRNLEIILVDDGSTDRSGDICEDYANKDSRIRVIHQDNAGLSAARNAGVHDSSGEYVTFLDGDDLLASEAIKILLDAALKYGADVVTSSYRRVRPSEAFYAAGTDREFNIMTAGEALEAICFPHELSVSSCGKLYRASHTKESAFPHGKTFEDVATIPMIIARAEIVAVGQAELYGYVARPGSITGERTISKQKYMDFESELDRLVSFLKSDGRASQEAIAHFKALSWLRILRLLPEGEDSYFDDQKRSKLMARLHQDALIWRRDGRVSQVERMRWLLFSISPTLYSATFKAYAKLSGLNVV